MSWSPQQEHAIKSVRSWLKEKSAPQVFRVFGFAGTGKTTLAKEIAGDVRKVLYGAFTGKAALVLRSKGCTNASTIHSLIYTPEDADMGAPRWVLKPDSDVADANLVIIDECSMVDERLGHDLLSFGTRVLVLGDPAQLPPVKGAGFFTEAEPDVMLTEVHRQARDNPIIRMSMTIREGGRLDHGTYGESEVITRQEINSEKVLSADQVIVGLNRTRQTYNTRIRDLLGRTSVTPVPDDRLVCLRNAREKGLLNGSIWSVEKIRGGKKTPANLVKMVVRPEDFPGAKHVEVSVLRNFFEGTEDRVDWNERRGTDEFTYGYALTCHKSQGSQWKSVVIFDESSSFREDRSRWLYTAITRAAEKVTVVA